MAIMNNTVMCLYFIKKINDFKKEQEPGKADRCEDDCKHIIFLGFDK
jgi:hypothetical protein